MRRSLPLPLATLFVLGASVASAQTVDFSLDATGVKSNGFVSAQSSLVSFSATPSGHLEIGDYGTQSHGKAIAVFGDDANMLLMTFANPMASLSLSFGNDQYGYIDVGGIGRLTLFNGAMQIGQVDVTVNGDDIMNQTVAFSGAPFTSATFQYRNSNAQAANLIEIVDDVTFSGAAVTATPEPATFVLAGTGLLALGAVARRRRREA